MVHIEEIEMAIKNLPASDLSRFRRWFASYDAEAWNTQIEEGAASEKLDDLANDALHDYKIGKTKEI